MIKYSKQEKHVQAKLVEKINGIRQSTLTDDIKESKVDRLHIFNF